MNKLGFKIKLTFTLLSSLIAIPSAQACSVDLSDFVGWTIIYAGTVTGYISKNGKKHDDFEGCDFGRVLILDYTKGITCESYGYQYAYQPKIVVLSNGGSLKACIGSEVYDVTR